MKKLFTLFVAALFCSTTILFAQEDTRTIISQCTYTGFNGFFETGMTWNSSANSQLAARFVCSEENPPYHIEYGMGDLYKKVAGDWEEVDMSGTILTEGTYMYYVQIRIDSPAGLSYRFPDNAADLTVTIDGVDWEVEGGYIGEDYCYRWIESPEFELEHVDLPFQFTFNTSLNYNRNYKDVAVTVKDLTEFTTGGTGSYSYSKLTNHAAWLTVSAAGIISGTPTELDEKPYYDTIRVTDGVEADTFRIYVGPVYPAPADREVVDVCTFTGFAAPAIGTEYSSSVKSAILAGIHPAEGAKYTLNIINFMRQNGEDWELVENGHVFAAGTYNMYGQVRLDDPAGFYYVLAEANALTASIDGTPLTLDNGYTGEDYSYRPFDFLFVISETTALDNANVNANAVKRIVNGMLLIERGNHTYTLTGQAVK